MNINSIIKQYIQYSNFKRGKDLNLNINENELIRLEKFMLRGKTKNYYDESKIKVK